MFHVLNYQFEGDIEGPSVIKEVSCLRKLLLVPPDRFIRYFVHELHVNGVIWVGIEGNQSGPVELASEVLPESVEKPVI